MFNAAAEDMPLPDGAAVLVTACTAYHWFSGDAFIAEAIRVLAPDGVVAMLRNRPAAQPLLQRFDAFIAAESCDDLCALESRREPSVRQLAAIPGLKAAKSLALSWTRQMDRHELVSMYLTQSVVVPVVHKLGLGTVLDTLHRIYAEEAGDGPVAITYETTVKYARRR